MNTSKIYEEAVDWLEEKLSHLGVSAAAEKECYTTSNGRYRIALCGVPCLTEEVAEAVEDFYGGVVVDLVDGKSLTHYLSISIERYVEENSSQPHHVQHGHAHKNKPPNVNFLWVCIGGAIITAAAAVLIE